MRLICWHCLNWYNENERRGIKVGSPCPMCFDEEPCASCENQDEQGSCSREIDCGKAADMYPLHSWEHDLYVNVYLVDLVRGGPEEGGWYYEAGQPVESRLCHTVEEADKTLAYLNAHYNNENKGRRPISSVLSDGEYRVCLEAKFAEGFPIVRPHYE